MTDKWLDRTISVRAGVVEEIVLQSQCNSVLLMNFDTTNNLYVSLSRSVSNAEYMAVALPGSVAVLARPFEFDRIYLYSAADIPKIVLSEIKSINPMMLVSQMFSQTPVPQAVTVTGTVGLQPGNLNLEPVTKNLGVKVLDTVGLAPGDLNIDAVNKGLGVNVLQTVEVEPAGWTWKKVTAAGAGDITVKATPGKVAQLLGDSGVTVQLKDGAADAWKAGDYTGIFPIVCNSSIVLNFAGAGDAWILYR